MPKIECTIYNKERKEEFLKVFGTDTIMVKSMIPEYIITPNQEKQLAYFLDLDSLTLEQRENLILHLSEKFNQPIEFVRKDLDNIGVPILTKDCILAIENPMRWFG